jgi:hypothetical protein
MGCNSGSGDNSIAEQFAKTYATPTSGATNFVWYAENGSGIDGIWGENPFSPSNPNYLDPGSMRQFSPGRSQ